MKLSTLWLSEWVKFSLTEQQLADQLTMAGLEVDSVSPVAGNFTGVIVAQVMATHQHPDADKLTLCQVDTDTQKGLQIVCGAANVRPGIKVALAMIGAKLPGDFKIKESKLRGQLSQGMLCSSSELGITETSEGIMELDADAPLGMNLRDYLSLDDHVLDIDLTPNRADCFSVLGLAREVAVLNKLPLLVDPVVAVTPTLDAVIPINIKNPHACPHYCGRIIRQINPAATTPLWMAERLRRAGVRSVHPVVDVLNYVMIELGQPMHAFDLSTIHQEITVRFSHDSERLTLLDGQEIKLNDKTLIISDKNKPLALAGIMGGADSAVQANTRDIMIESAFFNPAMIAGVARNYGLFSDSSQRYERGVDPHLQLTALERATSLILSIVGGEAGPVIEALDKSFFPEPICFKFAPSKVKKLTGLDISLPQMRVFLEGLGIIISQETNEFWDVTIPSHRFDLQHEVDLVEEIIRLFGYNNIEAQPILATAQTGRTCPNEAIANRLAHWFCGKGYHETISYSFVDPELHEALYPHHEYLQLVNPISSELSQMRSGMWPGLIASMIYNVHRQQHAIKFFELGVVFDLQQQQLSERHCIAGLVMGKQGELNWSEDTRPFDFYDLKGDLESLFGYLKVNQVVFQPTTKEALHPGQSAEITIDGKHAGWMGVLHPKLHAALGLQHDVLLFELHLDALLQEQPPRYKVISKYPQIRRDLSFLVDTQITVAQIEQAVKSQVTADWMKGFDVFDVYIGQNIPEGKKSIAIALTLQDDTRTLVDDEINLLISAIIKELEGKFSIILRD